MVWLCVNKDGQELICQNKPTRLGLMKRCSSDGGNYIDKAHKWEEHKFKVEELTYWDDSEMCSCQDATYNFDIELPKGSIEKLIGKVLTWDDEPVKF